MRELFRAQRFSGSQIVDKRLQLVAELQVPRPVVVLRSRLKRKPMQP